MLSEFDLLSPETLSEALQFMAQKAPDVSPVAGGTNLIVDLRSGKHNRPYLVNIEALEELKGLRLINNKIQIGACTKINELINSQIIQENAQVLIDAAKTFANPLIRNRATIGGNLVDASPASDTAPPLLVLDAELELQSVNGSRVISIEDFFIHVRKTTLKPGEILTSISFPIPEPTTHFAYYKLGLRKADAISVVSLAVRIGFDSKGKCTNCLLYTSPSPRD